MRPGKDRDKLREAGESTEEIEYLRGKIELSWEAIEEKCEHITNKINDLGDKLMEIQRTIDETYRLQTMIVKALEIRWVKK